MSGSRRLAATCLTVLGLTTSLTAGIDATPATHEVAKPRPLQPRVLVTASEVDRPNGPTFAELVLPTPLPELPLVFARKSGSLFVVVEAGPLGEPSARVTLDAQDVPDDALVVETELPAFLEEYAPQPPKEPGRFPLPDAGEGAEPRVDDQLAVLQREYRSLMERGRFVEAEQVADRIMELSPEHPTGFELGLRSRLAQRTRPLTPTGEAEHYLVGYHPPTTREPQPIAPLVTEPLPHPAGWPSAEPEAYVPTTPYPIGTPSLAPTEPAPIMPAKEMDPTAAAEKWNSIREQRISFHFRDATVAEVAEFFHHATGLEVALDLPAASSPLAAEIETTGIHIRCVNRTVDQSLRVVLGACGLGYAVEGSKLVIAAPAEIESRHVAGPALPLPGGRHAVRQAAFWTP